MSSMNTRAPTDLYSRTQNNSRVPTSSYNADEAPDDEQRIGTTTTSRFSNNNDLPYPNPDQYRSSNADDTPHDEVDDMNNTDDEDLSSLSKKKKVKDRPWQKSNEYNSIATTCEEDMDIIGVSNTVSPNYKSMMSKKTMSANLNSPVDVEDNYSYDDVSSRWNNHQSSPDEAKAATVNAVGIAATQLADRLDEDEFEEDESIDIDSSPHPHVQSKKSDVENEFPTPRKTSDHNRVRMEALNLLNLANNKENGGYLVRGDGESMKNMKQSSSTKHSAEMKKNRVQSALKGLSGGLGLDNNRRKYDKFTPDKMEYDKDDDDVMQDVNIANHVEYVKNNASTKFSENTSTSKNGSWGSRYSVDRHLMALHGGLSSREVLKNMEQGHYDDLNNNQKSMSLSATNMFKTSPHEQGDRWNVTQGARSAPTRQYRLWNTWIAAMRETVDKVVTKVSNLVPSKNESHTTLGSHRHMNHSSSSPTGIFTGLAVTKFLDKLSPTSRSAAMRSFTDPDDIHFSAQDDYVYDQKLKRQKLFTILVSSLVILVILIGVVAGASNRNRSGIAPSIYSDVGEELQFYVTSDVPHNMADEIKLTRELANLHPRDGDFLIHLGDVGDASVNMCTMSVYQDAADLLKQCPIPVFVIPGDNDWNNCPDPRSALEYWMDELNRFEDNFDKEENTNFPVVRRQLARTENFSFLHKGVLFMAFHLVDGKVQSESEWSLRIAEDVAWMDEEFNAHGVEEYRAVVILAHSAPTPKVGDFVWPLKKHLMNMKKPVLYIHANDADGMLEYNPFPEDVPRLTVVRLEKGYKVSPTRISIETGPKPFKFEVNRK